MKSKKLIALFLALTLIALTACGGTSPTTSSPSVSSSPSDSSPSDSSPETQPSDSTPPASRDTVYITIGTASVGGSNYPVGVTLAQVWNENVSGVNAVAIATNGSAHNIDLLRTGDADAAVCRAIEANRAINGEETYPEKMPWIRALSGGLFADCTQVLSRTDVGIDTIYDFAGKRIAVGAQGSGAEIDARETLAAFGLTYEDIIPQYVEASQAIEMMEDGLIDACVSGLAVGSASIAELMMNGNIKLLSFTEEALEKLKEVSPNMRMSTIPANTYPNQDYEVQTAGSPPDHIICREEMDEDLVYDLVKAMYENMETMQGAAAVMSQFSVNLVLPEEELLLQYHPGAKRYFVEQGWLEG